MLIRAHQVRRTRMACTVCRPDTAQGIIYLASLADGRQLEFDATNAPVLHDLLN